MSKPGEEEIEFEINSKKKVNIPLKQVLKHENDVMKKIFLKLTWIIILALKQLTLLPIRFQRLEENGDKSKPKKEVLIWNPKGKRVLLDLLYLMFYHDDQGQVRYFSVVDRTGDYPKWHILERLIDQLSR